jgi:hypothetical protein
MERAPNAIARRGPVHLRRHVAAALLAAALVTTAAGCGGDASDTTATARTTATTPATGDESTPATGPMLPTGPSADTDPSRSTPATGSAGGVEPVGFDHTVFASGDIDPGLRPFVDRAVADLAARLDVDAGEVEVLTAVLVTWPSSALGCPNPKLRYPQVPVDGSVIELGAGERVYRYHTGGASELFLCERAWIDDPAAGGPTRVETSAPDATGDDG